MEEGGVRLEEYDNVYDEWEQLVMDKGSYDIEEDVKTQIIEGIRLQYEGIKLEREELRMQAGRRLD